MNADLLVPATAALLDGWCGPLVYVGLDGDDLAGCVRTGGTPKGRVRVFSCPSLGLPGITATCGVEELRLDLSRAECRAQIRRCLGLALEINPEDVRVDATMLDGEHCMVLIGDRRRTVERLIGLRAPSEPLLPDGSSRLVALALAAVARATFTPTGDPR